MIDRLTEQEIAILHKALGTNIKAKPKKRRMTTSKKAFIAATTFSILLVIFSAVMILLDKDTTTVSVFGGAGVACVPILYQIYDKYSTNISLMHMEKNYDPNYDENQGLY